FRTVELVQRPYANQNGSSMYLSVNGVPVFVKVSESSRPHSPALTELQGANFVPVDSFENRVTYDSLHWIIQVCTRERYRKSSLSHTEEQSAASVGMNTL